MLNWNNLAEINDLDTIVKESFDKTVLIFKHSTSCSISSIAKRRIEEDWTNEGNHKIYYLDLLRYRPISNAIAERFEVHHESPQILIISDGECVFEASHLDITAQEIMEELKSIA